MNCNNNYYYTTENGYNLIVVNSMHKQCIIFMDK